MGIFPKPGITRKGQGNFRKFQWSFRVVSTGADTMARLPHGRREAFIGPARPWHIWPWDFPGPGEAPPSSSEGIFTCRRTYGNDGQKAMIDYLEKNASGCGCHPRRNAGISAWVDTGDAPCASGEGNEKFQARLMSQRLLRFLKGGTCLIIILRFKSACAGSSAQKIDRMPEPKTNC